MKTITIAGNVTKDAEVRRTQNGDPVASFSVAVNGYENGQKTTTFFDVSQWGARGERLAPHVTKGGKVTVSGELGTREYNGKTYLTVRAYDVTLQGGGQQQGGYNPDQPGHGSTRPTADLDDEIPF